MCLPQPRQVLPPPSQAQLIVAPAQWVGLGIALGFDVRDGLLDALLSLIFSVTSTRCEGFC